MKKTKHLLCLLCIITLFISGCSFQTESPDTVTPTSVPSPSPTPFVKITENGYLLPELNITQKEIPDTEAMNFVRSLKIGWNLGNTFDANQSGGYVKNEMNIESSWCGIKTTKEMIQTVKDAGFNTLRLPVSWHNHLVDDDFTISEPWLDRVQEVVDYAIDCGMYVILNTHHDVAKDYYYPSQNYLEQSKSYIESIWKQLSERFMEYDNHLIFESMNEPRLKDTNYEWWLDLSKTECKESIDCVNQLNQLFVDTVRASGGQNADRYLMVPSYCAAADYAASALFTLPTDSAVQKLIVSVHAYTPYSFALQSPTDSGSISTFDSSKQNSTKDIDSVMKKMYDTFIVNGIPVVIGEFGARAKGDNLQDRVDFAAYYIAAAAAHGIPCCWWDNHAVSGSGELFGLLSRRTSTWYYPDILQALMAYTMN